MKVHRFLGQTGGRGDMPSRSVRSALFVKNGGGAQCPASRLIQRLPMVGCQFLETGESKMKKILIAAVALSALSANAFAAPIAPVAGAEQTEEITLNAAVDAACSAGPAGVAVDLGEISKGVGALDGAAVNKLLGGLGASITCNGAGTKFSVQASPLTNATVGSLSPAAIAAGFSRAVDYTATVALTGFSSAGVTSVADSSTLAAATQSTVGLLVSGGTLTLSAAAIKNGTILTAGAYNGSVQLTLTPGV
jgi:hypothetical protein